MTHRVNGANLLELLKELEEIRFRLARINREFFTQDCLDGLHVPLAVDELPDAGAHFVQRISTLDPPTVLEKGTRIISPRFFLETISGLC